MSYCRLAALPCCFLLLSACSRAPRSQDHLLLDVDFRRTDALQHMRLLDSNLSSTGIFATPHRRGVERALLRRLNEAPLWPDGQLDISRNEVGQGAHRLFPEGVPFDHREQALVLRMSTFSDAVLRGTNSIAVRLWAQQGLGPNQHQQRTELSTHFNAHARGARQLYPNAYVVRDGWETWAMPEGTNSRRAGIYYRLAAEGRNQEIRGPQAVSRGYYWDWQGLDWPKGWQKPLGGALYPPSQDQDELRARLAQGPFSVTAVYRQAPQRVSYLPQEQAIQVDVIGVEEQGRVLLDAPLPQRIHEIRLLLRSELPPEGQDWAAAISQDPLLGVLSAQVALVPRADANLDGRVDGADWQRLVSHFGQEEALHIHGDGNGDGRVDLKDVFLMARQWSQADPCKDADPSGWQATVDAEGMVWLHLPAESSLYAWGLWSSAGQLSPSAEALFAGPTALRQQDGQGLGEADLLTPLRISQSRTLALGRFEAAVDGQAVLLIQSALGQAARRLVLAASE